MGGRRSVVLMRERAGGGDRGRVLSLKLQDPGRGLSEIVGRRRKKSFLKKGGGWVYDRVGKND